MNNCILLNDYLVLHYKLFSYNVAPIRVWDDFRKQAADWLDDPEIYSLYDLTRVNSGELFQLLRVIVERGIDHVTHCEVIINISYHTLSKYSSTILIPPPPPIARNQFKSNHSIID